MKNLYALTASLLLLQGFCSAQDLAENNTKAAPLIKKEKSTPTGSPAWVKEHDQVNGRISGSKLTPMKKDAERIVAVLKDSCFSDGAFTPVWHGEYFSEKVTPNGQARYNVAFVFADQKAQLTIASNDMSSLLQPFQLNNAPIFSMQAAMKIKNGASCFEGANNSKIWLVTTGDAQPYTVVTRKEYLENALAELNTVKAGIIAELHTRLPIRTAEAQAAEKKAVIDDINNNYSGTEREYRTRQYLSHYKSDEDYFSENADQATANVDASIQWVDSLRTHISADDAKRPAIVTVSATDFRNFEDGQSDKILVKLNPAYLSLTVAAEKAQFFTVSWTYEADASQSAELNQALGDKLDCNKLKSLLLK